MKALQWIVLIVLILGAGALGYLWYTTDQEKQKIQTDLTQKWEAAKQDVKEKIQVIEDKEKAITQREGTIAQLQSKLKDITDNQMAKVKAAVAEKETQITSLNAKLKDFETQVTSLNTQVTDLKSELGNKDQEIQNVKNTVDEKNTMISGLQDTLDSWKTKFQEKADLADTYKKRLLDNEIPIDPEKQFVGHVLVMNNDPEFYVLDLGSADELPVGTELHVSRDGHYIGKIEVKKLLPDDAQLSYATLVTLADDTVTVQEGDIVRN